MGGGDRVVFDLEGEAVTLQETVDELLALARRVHAEWKPDEYRDEVDGRGQAYCVCCGDEGTTPDLIDHKPDCLWLAADKLKKEGLI